jgi:cytochrome c
VDLPTPAARDATAGEKVFKTQCGACHSGVLGNRGDQAEPVGYRRATGRSGFWVHYTEANKNSDLTWDAATLDRYVLALGEIAPGMALP